MQELIDLFTNPYCEKSDKEKRKEEKEMQKNRQDEQRKIVDMLEAVLKQMIDEGLSLSNIQTAPDYLGRMIKREEIRCVGWRKLTEARSVFYRQPLKDLERVKEDK